MCEISIIASERLHEDHWVRDFSYPLVHKVTYSYLGLWAILTEAYEDIREVFDEPRSTYATWNLILAE